MGCTGSSELFRVLIVPEDEIPEDEWIARHADAGSWHVVSDWRRDVSPSDVTLYLRTGDGNLSLEVSTALGNPDDLCAALVGWMRRRHEEPDRP